MCRKLAGNAKTHQKVGKDYVLPMEENRVEMNDISLSASDADAATEENYEEEIEEDTDPVGENGRNEREQYNMLIKNRFKDFYAEDTQRLINRRFRKYKIMEERYKYLEESLREKEERLSEKDAKIAEFDELLKTETERIIKETEERILSEIKAKKLRPEENGAIARREASQFDVSRLTKNERATLARRAASGEKIKF